LLSPRADLILKYIVGQYIASATPVPSQFISGNHEMEVSPATIRNEMAHLQQEGYILRPHTSAGSMPSEKGYRYYVESLNKPELPLAEQRMVSHLFHQAGKEMEKWLSLTATLIARLTHNMAIAAVPKQTDCQFKYVELAVLQDSLVLAILILRGGRIRQQLITFDEVISQTELTAITNKLNIFYSGLTRPQLSAKKVEFSPVEQQIVDCLVQLMQAEDDKDYEEPYLEGLHFMLSQPEFAHSQQVLALLELVEHRNLLRTIIPQEFVGQEIQVIIGKENQAEDIQNCSVVISRYGLPGEAVGTIGVIGPTRMPYARTISTNIYKIDNKKRQANNDTKRAGGKCRQPSRAGDC